jgi:hypothetical protein
MDGPPISPETLRRIEQVFPEHLRTDVVGYLVTQCGWNLPYCERDTAMDMERIRFAVLKLSNGTVDGLLRAIQEAQIDWRDVLVSAGFGNDVESHKRWLAS